MVKLKSFIKDFSIVAIGNTLSKLLAAVCVIIIARYLGPEDFGKFSILFSIMVIISSGLTGLDITYVYNKTGKSNKIKFSYHTYVSSKFLIAITIAIIGITSVQYLNKYIFHNEVSTVGLVITFFSALSFIAFTQTYTFYQAKEDFVKYSWTRIIFNFLVLLIAFIFIYSKTNKYYIFTIPYLITGFIIFLTFFLFNKEIFIFKKNLSLINFYKTGKWIILSEICFVLITRLDFLILSHYIKGEILGFYSVALRIINIYLMFTAAFSAIMLPKASGIKNNNQVTEFYKASFFLFLFLTSLNIILIFSSNIIIRILFGVQYLPSAQFTQLLLIAYIPFTLYQPFRYLTYTFNKTHILFLVPFLQIILLLTIGPFFIDRFGPKGIIIAKTTVFIIGFIIFFSSVIKRKISD